jgi:uncharacterized protein
VPDFENLTITAMLDEIDAVLERDVPKYGTVGIIGSDLGGFAGLLSAFRNERVCRLFLLAPTFGLFRLSYLGLGRRGVEQWEKKGHAMVRNHAMGIAMRISSDIIVDSQKYREFDAEPRVSTTIIHGQRDEMVDPHLSVAFGHKFEKVTTHLVDDDHSLRLSTTQIWEMLWQDIRPQSGTGSQST